MGADFILHQFSDHGIDDRSKEITIGIQNKYNRDG